MSSLNNKVINKPYNFERAINFIIVLVTLFFAFSVVAAGSHESKGELTRTVIGDLQDRQSPFEE